MNRVTIPQIGAISVATCYAARTPADAIWFRLRASAPGNRPCAGRMEAMVASRKYFVAWPTPGNLCRKPNTRSVCRIEQVSAPTGRVDLRTEVLRPATETEVDETLA